MIVKEIGAFLKWAVDDAPIGIQMITLLSLILSGGIIFVGWFILVLSTESVWAVVSLPGAGLFIAWTQYRERDK